MSEVSHTKDVLHTINLVTQCLCIPIVTLFVGLRFYTRLRFKQPLGVEDCKLFSWGRWKNASPCLLNSLLILFQMAVRLLGYVKLKVELATRTGLTPHDPAPIHGILWSQHCQ